MQEPIDLETLRGFIDGNADVIYEADTRGRFTFVNAAVHKVLGYDPDGLIGRHFSDLVQDDWKAAVVEHYRHQSKTGEESTYYEFPAVGANGRVVWFGQTVQRVVKSGGTIVFQAIGRDVTQRRADEQRFHQFMNHSPAVKFMKQADGCYVYANDLMNRLFAQPGSSVVGSSDADLLPASIENTIRLHDEMVLREGRSIQVMESAPTIDGQVRQWLTYKFPVEGADGTRFVGGVAFDLTERIALEHDLAAARDAALASARQKSQFLANMSHEIRTPMNGVIGMLGLLLDSRLDDDQRELAETARSSAEALLTIINDILDFSKIEAGKLTFDAGDFNVRTACEATIDLLSDAARRKSLDLGYVIDPQVPAVIRGDVGRLRQILLNLLGNAVKFSEEGGVLLQVDREADVDGSIALRFRVTDTGPGIAEETQRRLFQPFSQGDETTTRSFGGTGLGLAISKQLVHMMHGEIGVDSEPGCGSSFWFTARFATSSQPAEAVEPPRDAPRRVLVVEDSTTSRHMVSLQLSAWGVLSEAAGGGTGAIRMLTQAAMEGAPYDLILSDFVMPDMDGATLARIVRGNPALGSPRVVLITGSAQKFDAVRLAELGISHCLSKPVKQLHLFSAIFGQKAAAPPKPAKPVAPLRAHGRVLVVDDNVVNQKVTVRQLHKLGIAAEAVGNGLEALTALEKIAYDLVLMDCQMPEMDGYEATAEIRRRQGDSSHTPVIALTASASDSDRDRCLAAGMDDFVTKPVREHELAAALQRWMNTTEEPERMRTRA
jgi:PAS domain S-box-containing protein